MRRQAIRWRHRGFAWPLELRTGRSGQRRAEPDGDNADQAGQEEGEQNTAPKREECDDGGREHGELP